MTRALCDAVALIALAVVACEKKRELQDFPHTVGGLSFGTPREEVAAACEKLRSTPYDVGSDSSFACAPCPDPPVANIEHTLAKFCRTPQGPVLCELDFIPYQVPTPDAKVARQRHDETLVTLRERFGEPYRFKPPHIACDEPADPFVGNQYIWGWGKKLLEQDPMSSSRGVVMLSYGCTDRKKLVVTLAYRDRVGVKRGFDETIQKQLGTAPSP